MSNGSAAQVLLLRMQDLLDFGVAADLSDTELLDRFLHHRGNSGEAAFRALVARHGPMVLRVCFQALRDEHEAEDAFQATFLVLARRAGSIRRRHSVPSWLFGVACRAAARIRAERARRREYESRNQERSAA